MLGISKEILNFTLRVSTILWLLCASTTYAQEMQKPIEPNAQTKALEAEPEPELIDLSPQLLQMDELQTVISTKIALREKLRGSIKNTLVDDLPELEAALAELNAEIRSARGSFDQLAVGSAAGTDLFEEKTAEVDWRQELTLIMMPLMENLKLLTEKPRKTQNLKAQISLNQQRNTVAKDALASIEQALLQVEKKSTKKSLDTLLISWQDRRDEAVRNINLANVQLNNLQKNNVPWWLSLKQSMADFAVGRGLTLLFAIAAALAVWFGVKLLASIFSKKSKGEDAKTFRTRQRIVRYALRAMTALLMLISVIMVFYIRGDVLLMGLSFLIAAGVILGLRNTIPKFISELRLLLNMGGIREGERVMHNGLPWKVVSLNMDTVLKNPEISGIIRLPLRDIEGLVSRPAGNEPWFPASKNDLIFFAENQLMEVTGITPELVSMQSLSGTKMAVPASEFYQMSFENLSQGDTFSVSGTFGIGYSHQSVSVVEVPRILIDAVSKALNETDLAESVVKVSVELKEAGASSLDYWVGVSMKSEAAKSYNKISRLIQQVCVTTCTAENWDIPFPQLTLHRT